MPQALAKELSAKGKAAAEAMWAAHERASSQIYSQRNARLQQQVAAAGGGGKGSAAAPVIDLHGECWPEPTTHTAHSSEGLAFLNRQQWSVIMRHRTVVLLVPALSWVMRMPVHCSVAELSAPTRCSPPPLQGCTCRR